MALTAPRGYAGGPMADIDYGYAAAGCAWVESTGNQLQVTQPSTGTRTISISAGTGVAFGIRVTNDAVLTQALTAPASGGQWYLIALRFNWSARTVALNVMSGASTGGTATPTIIPTALPAAYSSLPGATVDLPLAWVFVNSANTTATIFDLRMADTGAKGVAALTLWALLVVNMTLLRNGATVPVLDHLLPSGAGHRRSLWQRVGGADNGYLTAVGLIEVNDTNSSSSGRADILTIATSGYTPNIGLTNNVTEVASVNSGNRYRYNGGGGWTQV